MTAQQTRLTLESLDERALPSTVVYSGTAQCNSSAGAVSVTTVVTDREDGSYSWNYHLTNDSFSSLTSDGWDWGVGVYTIDLPDITSLTGLGGGASIGVTDHGDGSGSIWLYMGDDITPGLTPGQSVDFAFSTLRERVLPSRSWGGDPGIARTFGMPVVAPAALAVSSINLATPLVTWPDASKLPTAMSLTTTVVGAAATGAPTGTVKFYDGVTEIGNVALVAGANNTSTAALATAGPTVGSHTIKAVYQGDANYKVSTSADTRVDLDETTGGSQPLPVNTQPTGGNLTWANFTASIPKGVTSGAYTSGPLAWTAQLSLVTLTIVEADGVANSQCRAMITAAQFTCRFMPSESYAVQNSRTDALLAHENLHMTIGEFIATRAAANRPSMLGKGGGQSTDIAQAKLNAKTVAERDILNRMTAYALKWVDVNESASRSYDNGTALPGQGGGSNPQTQADWLANWQAKVQQILVNSGWN